MAKVQKPKTWDFEGWATRYGVRCGDGEIIAHGAFKDMDGVEVPLVDDHARGYTNYLDAVLGRAYLEHRDEGVYSYISFNPKHQKALLRRDQVEHGDIQKLSIKANDLTRKAGAIVRGIIRDLSIVSAGANPGAYILQSEIHHSDGYVEEIEDECLISCDDDVSPAIEHSADEINTEELNVGEVYDSMTPEQKTVAMFIAATLMESAADSSIQHGDEDEDDDIDLTEDEIADIDAALAAAEEGYDSESNEDDESEEDDDTDDEDDQPDGDSEQIQHSYDGGKKHMAGTVQARNFRNPAVEHSASSDDEYLGAQVDVQDFIRTLEHGATLQQACIEHGVNDFSELHDLAIPVNPEPLIVNAPQGWVKTLLSGVKKVPFTKIKSLYTDFSDFENEDLRAKGYPELGAQKLDQAIDFLTRTTEPGWMYKRQKIDRDTLYQITSFNFLAWLQSEMGMMLNQEAAVAILMGDGRAANSPSKIKETCIRPISKENDVWAIQHNLAADITADETLDVMLGLRSDYQGTGTPTMFTSPAQISTWLQAKDATGRRLYKSVSEIAELLQVSEIVGVPRMTNRLNETGKMLKTIMVNLQDYALSMPTGSAALKDTKFDIDFNKEIYLLEWLVGGALIVPKSAIVVTQSTT